MKTELSYKARLDYAKKDLRLKLTFEGQLEKNIQEPLADLYKYICDNRLYSVDSLRASSGFGNIRAPLVECLVYHYKQTWKSFRKEIVKGFRPQLQTKGATVNDDIDPSVERLLRRRAEQQADIIIDNSAEMAKKKRNELIAALLEQYIDEYREEMQEEAEDESDHGALLLLLAALGTRSALISQVETGNAGEIAKLITTLEVRDALRRAASGETSVGDAYNDVRTALHTSENLTELIDQLSDDTLVEVGDPKKEWNAILDNKVRPTHAAADGQVVSLMEYFKIGTSLLLFPGDTSANPDMSEIYNCRCIAMYY